MITIENRGSIRHVVLNRPEKRNAFNAGLVEQTGIALASAADDPSVRCVVIRGEGAVFSSGMDVGELMQLAGSASRLREFRRGALTAWNLAEEMAKPTIAQIHGACIGGAFELALACDMRVVAQGSRLSIPEVKLGLIPDVGGSSRLPAIVGLGRAKELILTGREFDADEAYRIGFANQIAAEEDLDSVTQALAEELTANFPVPVGLAKRVMDASARPALSTTLELEVTAQEVCVASLAAAMRDAQTDD
jgi:enoyl-CoA hydratase/carnithine racemase